MMTNVIKAEVVREGFGYLEGFRWHDNEVWFSDIQTHKVYRMSSDGQTLNTVASGEVKFSGLGFPENDQPFVVVMTDNTLRRIKSDGDTEIVADLSEHAISANDMWVHPSGRSYISQIGYDLFNDQPKPSSLVIVQPDGSVETGGEGVVCPNGIQLTEDGKTLIVAESFAYRLSAFDVDEEGRLSNKRVIKQFEDQQDALDGLVLDSEGAIWVSMPFRGEVRRITQDGIETDTVKTATEGHLVVSCALGGADGRDLYMATADTEFETLFDGTARVEVARVSTPGIYR